MPLDNEVFFDTESANIIWGKFTISEFCVTSGVDKDIKVDDVTYFRKSDKSGFHFSADHSGSTEVATWFHQRISAAECTFQHVAEKLNFAVFGTLVLGFHWDEDVTLTYENVGMAQGHQYTSNNWWFGVKGSTYMGGPTNVIYVHDASGTYKTAFHRGNGNSVNAVGVWFES